MSNAEALLREFQGVGLWLGRHLADCPAESTGYPELDPLLPGHGWPRGALTELLHPVSGCGELSLLLPALARLSQAGCRIALVNPPYIPYAPALAQQGVRLDALSWVRTESATDAQWAAEQLLRSGATGAVLLWQERLQEAELRRLQLAAETGQALCFLYRSVAALSASSPAALRLALQPADPSTSSGRTGLNVELVKARGGRAGARLHCAVHSA